jgi:hypothetical protein
MKLSDSKLPRLLAMSVFALLCLCVGYLMPHRPAALAETPCPTASMDDVPGGGHGNGNAMVTEATATTSAKLAAGKSGWPCAKGKQCAVSFRFRVTPKGSVAPTPFTCPRDPRNCFTFTSPDYTYSVEDYQTGKPIETVTHVQMAGVFQL